MDEKTKIGKRGFTLLEVLLVVAALGILAATVILAINPAHQLSKTRDAQRWSDVTTLLNAVYEYSIDHSGNMPSGITTELQILGTAGSGCGMLCGALSGEAHTFLDDTQADFNIGAYSETQYDAVDEWLELTATGRTNGSGTYDSSIKDAGAVAVWSTLSWTPTWPFGKELPGNEGTESGYANGNVDMTGNQFLFHFNELAGATSFADGSGTGHPGVCASGCPVAGTAGKLNTAVTFNGVDDRLRVGTIATTGDFTISAWIKPVTTTCPGSSDCEIVQSSSGLVFDFNDGTEYRICSIWPACVSVPISNIDIGVWQQVAATRSGSTCTLYKNGVAVPGGSGICSTAPQEGVFYVGAHSGNDRFFDGDMDEVSLWTRALSGEEVSGLYHRGALRLSYRVRSCDDPICDTEDFIGPDGTTGTYFSELGSSRLTPPSFTFSNVSDDQYFQYRAYLETDDASYSPETASVTVGYGIGGIAGEQTADSCIDLSSALVSDYVTDIPEDPRDGGSENTFYAIKRTSSNRIEVKACSNEEEIINVSR